MFGPKPEPKPAEIEELIAQHNTPQAIALAEQHVRRQPKDFRALLALGTAYTEAGRRADAVRAWQKAYDLAGDIPEVRLFLLCGLWESGDKDSPAVQALLGSLRTDPAEFTFTAPFSNPALIARAMEKYGMTVLKGCFSKELIRNWDRNLRDNLSYVTDVRGYELAGNIEASADFVVPSYFMVRQPDPTEFGSRFAKGVDRGNPFLPIYYTQNDVQQFHDDVIPALDRNEILTAIAGYLNRDKATLDTRHDYSAARVIHVTLRDLSGCPHQDGRLQSRTDLFATLWTPFILSGGTHAASVAAVPVRLNTYFPVDGKSNWFERDAFPEELYYKGEFEPGDVLLHSTFTLHKSYVRTFMQNTRTSIDLRIF